MAADTAGVKPFRFLDLPPALRNQIYSILLESDTAVKMVRLWIRPDTNIQPNILRTCHQIRNEATTILYANNVFKSDFEQRMLRFLEEIGKSAQHLRHVEIQAFVFKGYFKASLAILKRAKWLQSFTIRKAPIEPEKLAKELGPMMRALHKARKQQKEFNFKSVLDVLRIAELEFEPMWSDQPMWSNQTDAQRERRKAEHEKYEKEVKELIGATLR